MAGYNIYQKPCPECSAVVPNDTARCSCGHQFENDTHDSQHSDEQALQEEELFAAYLAARIDQIVAAVEAARAELTSDTLDLRKTEHLLQSVQEALSLRDERDAQMAKIAVIRETIQASNEQLTPATPDGTVQTSEPTEKFKTQQAEKAEKIIEAYNNTETKECMHCKTVLPVTSVLCCCGYIFSRHELMLPRAVDSTMRGELYRPK
ncbi:MAG: hypothetical protein WD823_07485 [Sulfuricaulis sp.]|uniref:hypothetical protein n=1 Tax=Sulfuricaulis sp. TaxID=2003553 RepID=UPI0034A4714C